MTSLKINSMTGRTTLSPMRKKNSPREGTPSVTMYSSGPKGLSGLGMLNPKMLRIPRRAPTKIDNTPDNPATPCMVAFHSGVKMMLRMERTASDR